MLIVTKHSSFSDWIFLYYLAKNMEPYIFRDMLIDLANELRLLEMNDDISDEDYGSRNEKGEDENSNENNKNDEVNMILLSSEKNK